MQVDSHEGRVPKFSKRLVVNLECGVAASFVN
jgi:hypothetical protein